MRTLNPGAEKIGRSKGYREKGSTRYPEMGGRNLNIRTRTFRRVSDWSSKWSKSEQGGKGKGESGLDLREG